jgi:hypothetical protein
MEKEVGLYFGRFVYELIWSPWMGPKLCRAFVLIVFWKPFVIMEFKKLSQWPIIKKNMILEQEKSELVFELRT